MNSEKQRESIYQRIKLLGSRSAVIWELCSELSWWRSPEGGWTGLEALNLWFDVAQEYDVDVRHLFIWWWAWFEVGWSAKYVDHYAVYCRMLEEWGMVEDDDSLELINNLRRRLRDDLDAEGEWFRYMTRPENKWDGKIQTIHSHLFNVANIEFGLNNVPSEEEISADNG